MAVGVGKGPAAMEREAEEEAAQALWAEQEFILG